MHKILFISFEFHPVQTTGNFRAAKFVKYFEAFGIEPIVLCGDEDSILQYFKGGRINNKLLDEIPTGCQVYRVPFDKPYRPSSKYSQIKYYADPIYKFWKKNSFKKACEIIHNNPDIKSILVSLPPFSVGELALKVSRKFHLPLFVDLRDAWSNQGQFPFFTRFHYLLNLYKERELLMHATKIVTVTNQLADIYRSSHPKMQNDKIQVVYNSYESIEGEDHVPIKYNRVSDKEKYIVGYIGSFYYSTEGETIRKTPWWKRKGFRKLFYYPVHEEWLYRSPFFFFKALSIFKQKYPDYGKNIFFGHIGDTPLWIYDMADEFGLRDKIISYGFVKKNNLINVVKEFSALLATTEKIPNNLSFCFPSKTFDYITYGKPIIGLVKNGDFSSFLEKINMGVVIDPDNLDQEMKKLELFFLEAVDFESNIGYMEKFHAREQTKLMSNTLKQL